MPQFDFNLPIAQMPSNAKGMMRAMLAEMKRMMTSGEMPMFNSESGKIHMPFDKIPHGFKITRITDAAYTVDRGDDFIVADASAAAITVTLPSSAAYPGRPLIVKRFNPGANAVTIAAPGGQTIDGAASYVLSSQWQTVMLLATGNNYLIGFTHTP